MKQGTGLYQFLDRSGVLEHGTNAEIQQAKREYWRNYKKQWKKEKRKESKLFEILLNQYEYKKVQAHAKKERLSITKYIKQMALHDPVVNPVTVGAIRELLMLEYNYFEAMLENAHMDNIDTKSMLDFMLDTEHKILKMLRP